MKILLVTRHYPPAVSGGARRPFLLAKALRDAGATVSVVAPSLPEGEPGVAVSHPHRDPSTSSVNGRWSFRNTLRDVLLWPDPDIRWARQVVAAVRTNLDEADWVLTTSPPESIHYVGLALKLANPNLRWMADFRDHWLQAPHRIQRNRGWRRAGEKLIGRRWLSRADGITAVDQHIAEEMGKFGGPDPLVLPHFAPVAVTKSKTFAPERIHIVHAGSISLSDPLATIDEILEPFEVALRHNPKLRLHFVGRLTDEELASISRSGCSSKISVHGVMPYEDALGFIFSSDALIYVASSKANVPPSKIVEYLATDKPVIACGDGPWRRDPRVLPGEPVEQLIELAKGAKRPETLAPPTANDTAMKLLNTMRNLKGFQSP